ncbi:MAG: 5/3-nucleotidase [Gaiellaceae bacterium]|nr:5/3-nucleotidase [Gaiellaceae bacterium]
MRVLLTNDDGIGSPGLIAVLRALAPIAETVVIAPAENQSAVARSITLRRAMTVVEHDLAGAAAAYAVDGTPVDCVRFAALGLGGGGYDAVVSGANLGHNLGDDVTYSGTVAAALEGVLLGLPAIAVSQGALDGGLGFVADAGFDFEAGARFTARLLQAVLEHGLPAGLLLNVNVPPSPTGARIAALGRRIYRDSLDLIDDRGREKVYRIYGADHAYDEQPGSDFEAVAEGFIAVTPLRFDLAVRAGDGWLYELDLGSLL